MKICLRLDHIPPESEQSVGGKSAALARLARQGHDIPPSLCIPVEAYFRHLRETPLGDRILMELGRKDFDAMRWEEIWDAALRIRNLFQRTPMPEDLERQLGGELREAFGDRPVAVRSSAPGEDAEGSSFAGLHDSFVNVRGEAELLLAVRRVWASLWSDRALLYRRELGLDTAKSAMAVLVQELVAGERSGVAFSRSPVDPKMLAVEAVWGLNQGLVDGSVEPDHWDLDRGGSRILSHRGAERRVKILPDRQGVGAVPVEEKEAASAPLSDGEVLRVAKTALDLERYFGLPQDVEWTFGGSRLVLLQSRPTTTRPVESEKDQRGWFLSLHRSMENLKALRRQIEEEIIPGMERDAGEMAAVDPGNLSDDMLAAEIGRRRDTLARWEEIYRTSCIPMAHGIRLFGEFYNDAMRPENPFEFVLLLRGGDLAAVERNRRLEAFASEASRNPELLRGMEQGGEDLPKDLEREVESLCGEIGWERPQLLAFVAEMARAATNASFGAEREGLEHRFLEKCGGEGGQRAEEMLELGRASYRLRDDDNISIGKVRRQLARAEDEGRRRLEKGADGGLVKVFEEERRRALHRSTARRPPSPPGADKTSMGEMSARQLQGQPASPGIASGPARVVRSAAEMSGFRTGEILVCDAIDPTMTFIVPLAAGIVERRGGMLIHGAIIAREYGIPCVTGVPEASAVIRDGEQLTVDGHLGLVFISRPLS